MKHIKLFESFGEDINENKITDLIDKAIKGLVKFIVVDVISTKTLMNAIKKVLKEANKKEVDACIKYNSKLTNTLPSEIAKAKKLKGYEQEQVDKVKKLLKLYISKEKNEVKKKDLGHILDTVKDSTIDWSSKFYTRIKY